MSRRTAAATEHYADTLRADAARVRGTGLRASLHQTAALLDWHARELRKFEVEDGRGR